MCIYLERTTDSRDRSYAVFDHDHLDVLSQEEFRRAVEQLQYFIEDVIGTDPEIDRINGRICIYALAPDEPEQSEYDLWDSFVPASSPEDGEWKMMDLVALLDDLAQVGRQGITSIDLCAGACTLPDGTSIRTTDWDWMAGTVNSHWGALEDTASFRTGFLAIRMPDHTLPLTARWMRELKRGLRIALDTVRISGMS